MAREGERLALYSPAKVRERFASRGVPLPDRLPGHIQPFANFMDWMKGREITPRDVIKAYIITRASVQRTGLPQSTICEAFPEYREMRERGTRSPKGRLLVPRSSVRPEDLMSRLLLRPEGRAFLDDAEQGRYNVKAAKKFLTAMECFGMTFLLPRITTQHGQAGFLENDLKRAVRDLPEQMDDLIAITSPDVPPVAAYTYVRRNVWGIDAAKTGFFLSLLGRGDIPTFDAVEARIWRRGNEEGRPTWRDVENLSRRFDQLGIRVPKEHRDKRKHLIHHMLWDLWADERKPESSKTTHGEVIRAMQFAGPRYRLVSRR
jgi:hypothetical protein